MLTLQGFHLRNPFGPAYTGFVTLPDAFGETLLSLFKGHYRNLLQVALPGSREGKKLSRFCLSIFFSLVLPGYVGLNCPSATYCTGCARPLTILYSVSWMGPLYFRLACFFAISWLILDIFLPSFVVFTTNVVFGIVLCPLFRNFYTLLLLT